MPENQSSSELNETEIMISTTRSWSLQKWIPCHILSHSRWRSLHVERHCRLQEHLADRTDFRFDAHLRLLDFLFSVLYSPRHDRSLGPGKNCYQSHAISRSTISASRSKWTHSNPALSTFSIFSIVGAIYHHHVNVVPFLIITSYPNNVTIFICVNPVTTTFRTRIITGFS